jgi:hypothetical protein
MAARPKQAIVGIAAALVLFSVLGAFFHQHGPIPATPSASCAAADSDAHFGHSHLLPADDGDAGDCAICFFNRCASHGAPVVAHAEKIEFDATPIVGTSRALHDSLPSRLHEARGPPVA